MSKNQQCPFLSVIVPVYNTEAYISQCIESIRSQTWIDLEIIIIDDGSTDGSPHICDLYSKKDARIKTYHTPNKGSVHARKLGIKHAKGTYIGFVDSDDWISPTMYQQMCASAYLHSADTIICDVFRYTNSGETLKWTQAFLAGVYSKKNSLDTIFSSMLYTGVYYEFGFLPCVWNKIFRKELIERYVYQIDEEITIGDDVCLTLFCLWRSNKIVYLKDQYLYYYRDTQNSITKRNYVDQFEQVIRLLNYLEQEIVKVDIKDTLRKQYEYYTTLMVSNVIFELYKSRVFRKEQRTHILSALKTCHSVEKIEKTYSQMNLPSITLRALDLIYHPTLLSEIKLILSMFKNTVKLRGKN